MAKPQTDHRKVVERGQWDDAVRAYLASIRFTDACLGEVLTALDEGPNAQNTIVVLWSDHGWHLGEKQHWRKFALWERATRVVLVCRLPQDRESRVCAAPVSLLDIYPSLVELCDLPPVAGLDGQSFVPLINDPQRETSRYAITTEGRANHAVRDARYRLIRYADQSTELYDHQADPHEWRNLTDDPALAEVKERLLAQLPTEDAQYTPPLRRARGNRGGE